MPFAQFDYLFDFFFDSSKTLNEYGRVNDFIRKVGIVRSSRWLVVVGACCVGPGAWSMEHGGDIGGALNLLRPYSTLEYLVCHD